MRPLTDEQRTQTTALLVRARALVGRFVVPAAPAGARLFVDGAAADPGSTWPAADGVLLLAVGQHEVTLRDEANHSSRATVVVRGGEDTRLPIDLAPLAAPPASPDLPPPDLGDGGFGLLPQPGDPAPPADTSTGSGAGPWILAGIGAGLAVVGAIVLVLGLGDTSTVEDAPAGTEWADVEDANSRAPTMTTAGGLILGVGGAIAAVGIVWTVTD